ncbi:hypothetical protein SASPL_123097 [Salvia splendens]|uniref:Uncharacterized protein n=1 Tax=Salvia splendens TaxID=180675 RepID=A0A8X8XPK8_SALSN|nr:hypothetical protein SASPL_123097 [Salvia splendens]
MLTRNLDPHVKTLQKAVEYHNARMDVVEAYMEEQTLFEIFIVCNYGILLQIRNSHYFAAVLALLLLSFIRGSRGKANTDGDAGDSSGTNAKRRAVGGERHAHNNNYNHNNGKAVWNSGRPDAYPATRFGGRQPRANRRENGGFRGPHGDDGDGESRQPEEPRMEETNPATLDLVLERLERLERLGKFETEREDPARRVDNLDHSWSRETDQPSGFGVGGR